MQQPLNNQENEEVKNPSPTTQGTGANELTNEILQQLKLKQAQTNNNENEGSATASGGFLGGFSRVSSFVPPPTPGLPKVGGDSRGSTYVALPAETNRRSRGTRKRVDCRPCGGCCGGLLSKSLSVDVYEFVRQVAGLLKLRECDVVNILCPLLECGRGRGSSSHLSRALKLFRRIKEFEKNLSRIKLFKAGYLVKRLIRADVIGKAKYYIGVAILEKCRYDDLLSGRDFNPDFDTGEIERDSCVVDTIRKLGFEDLDSLASYVFLIIKEELVHVYAYTRDKVIDIVRDGRVEVNEDEIKELKCSIPDCNWSMHAHTDAVTFLEKIIKHFRDEHGLKTVEGVEAKAEEVRRLWVKDFRPGVNPRLMELKVGELVDALISAWEKLGVLGYLGDDTWVCHLCEPNVKLRGKERAFEHVWHLHPQVRNTINDHNTDHA